METNIDVEQKHSLCYICKNADICKFKDEFEKLYLHNDDMKDKGLPIDHNIKCKYYRS